jgi:hypothetical protein
MPEDKKIEISESTLQGLMERLDKQAQDIVMLKDVADKSRVQRYQQKNALPGARNALISTYNGKIVMAWRTLSNEIFQDAKNLWHEDQTIEVITEDNEKVSLSYLEFVKKLVKVETEIVSRYTTPEGLNMIRLKMGDKQIDIDVTFVN